MSKDDTNQEEYISSLVFNKNTVEKHNLSQSCDYSFVWNETGVLETGVEFQASEVKPTDPKEQLNILDEMVDLFDGGKMQREDFEGKPLPKHPKYRYNECLAKIVMEEVF